MFIKRLLVPSSSNTSPQKNTPYGDQKSKKSPTYEFNDDSPILDQSRMRNVEEQVVEPSSPIQPPISSFQPITTNSDTDIQTGGDDIPQQEFNSSFECEYSKIDFTFGEKYSNFTLYEAYNRFYLVGCNGSKTKYKMLKIDRPNGADCDIVNYLNEDAGEYSLKQINDLLHMIKFAMKSIQQDIKLHTNNIYGILGFIELKSHHYLVLITDRLKVGMIGNASVYEIKDTKLVKLSMHDNLSKQEQLIEDKYKELFNNINLNQDFYFSYNYDLTKTLQQNSTPIVTYGDEPKNTTCDMFVWNSHLLEPLKRTKMSKWMCPCIHGHFIQSKVSMALADYTKPVPVKRNSSKELMKPSQHEEFNKTLQKNQIKTGNSNISIVLTVIARRSRYYAGTRYLKRGISDGGHVANHVEIEQIVYEANHHLFNNQSQGAFSSFVQVRGSIPLYWSQSTATTTTMTTTTTTVDENDQKNTTTTTTKASTSNLLSKPNIIITKFDPLYLDSMHHFNNLFERYEGSPIMCLDLVKQHEKKPREIILGEKFKICIEYLNRNIYKNEEPFKQKKHIEYVPFDFRNAIKDKPEKALNELHAIAENHVRQCKFFTTSKYGKVIQEQSGVLRTNCIDCLDRTGVAQFIIAKYVLGEQLCSLGIIESPHLVHHGQFILILMQMYEQVSDHIAIQYSGSRTVSVDIHNRGGVLADLMTNMKRYYSSNFKDEWKQHAINIFLGNYKPSFHIRLFGVHLWDLESGDIYLHDDRDLSMITDEEDSCDDYSDDSDDEEEVSNQVTSQLYFDETYNPRQITDLSDERLDQLSLTINSEVEDEIESVLPVKEMENKTHEKKQEKSPTSPIPTPSDNVAENEKILKSIMNSMKLTLNENGSTTVLPQGEILRSLEGKMSNEYPNISFEVLRDFYNVDVNSIYNNLQARKCIERNVIPSYDMDMYSNYTTEFNNQLIEEKNISDQSVQRSQEYDEYISQYFIENQFESKSITPYIVPAHNQTIYGQYVKYQYDVSFLNKKEVSKINMYKQVTSNDKKPKNNIVDGPLSAINSLVLLYKDDIIVLNKLKKFFPLAHDIDQLVSHIQVVIAYLKNNLTLLDRVRYPKQSNYSTSLYNLLKGKIYRKCFESKEAIDLLLNFNNTQNNDLSQPFVVINMESRKQAVEFYQLLLESNIIHHVNYGLSFIDGYYLYRFSNDNPIRVINMSLPISDVFSYPESIENIPYRCEPNAVLYKLMEYLRQMYQGIFPKYEKYNFRNATFFKTVSQHSRKIVCTNHIYLTQLLPLCHELSRIDLSSLMDVHEEKNERVRFRCFFLNLFLTLFYHSLLIMGSSSKYRLVGNNATFIFYNRMAYQVDGLIFSLSDIRDGILRGNKSYPNGIVTDMSHDQKNIVGSSKLLAPPINVLNGNGMKSFDRRSRFISFYSNYVDLRLIFIMYRYGELLWNEKSQISILPNSQQFKNMRMRNCCTLFPYITPENYESFVRKETELFLLQNIKIINNFNNSTSQSNNIIILPKLFRVYRESFGYTLQDISKNLIEKCMNHNSEIEQHQKPFNLLKEQLRHVYKHSHLYTVKEEDT
ncbi:phosphoinositide polyphosphatase domain protein [Naegleria gruberi]|uniref:Phosphoinositide polyphosphatase domain protein n=1 Tax=Naegleria gruberi TaxID=5762 RepID=D2VD56_NAEGR|nr:phosphoinositide polyphosphatase domain protein [Naegleria gruberi]EFC45272.1 phosphoinositide polyphosphatase domain protein [Naegleria gruberi]|eukprot:XP_002678016.1 phosphoinositide polyphosphatase domain protein [Naegleria gruberi strain NEG-M]